VNFHIRYGKAAAAILSAGAVTLILAGCGGGGGGGGLVSCLSTGGYGGGGGGGGGSCGNPTPQNTPDPSAQVVGILLTGENAVNDPTYGNVLGYSNTKTPASPNGSSVVHLTAATNVQFYNLEASGSPTGPHTASSLGSWSGSFPANGPTSAALTASPSGTSLAASGFTTGAIQPQAVSAVYTTGPSGGIIVFGCYFHYATNSMRTVVIVQ
jgi:hypothetical protein